ncbi:MAG: holo-ACP synthase [Fimbriimonadaceae bacterium]|nr:holo-ACP synthase [Fimbriimonadaceae bacterium]
MQPPAGIVGSGIDIVAIDRIASLYQRHGERFLARLLTPTERAAVAALAHPEARLAGRFAAKEAVMKALGTGWGGGVNFTDIEIVNDSAGVPRVTLSGGAAARCAQLGGRRWHLSISHCRDTAVAQALLEA